MTEGQIEGKWVKVQDNMELKITELQLVGSSCMFMSLFAFSLFLGDDAIHCLMQAGDGQSIMHDLLYESN